MTEAKTALLMFKGFMSELPEEEQKRIKACVEDLKKVVIEHGEVGQFAATFFAMEVACEAEEKLPKTQPK